MDDEVAMPRRLTGTVTGCWIVEGEGVESTHREMLTLNLKGIVCDRHSGFTRYSGAREAPFYPIGTQIRNDRQVSLVSAEEMAEIQAALGVGEILPGWLGANILIAGIPGFTALPATARLQFSRGTVLVVHHENYPCGAPGRVIGEQRPFLIDPRSSFKRAAAGRRGLVGWVERAGQIWLGDTVEVYELDEIIK